MMDWHRKQHDPAEREKAARVAAQLRARREQHEQSPTAPQRAGTATAFGRLLETVRSKTGVDPMAPDFAPPRCGLCGAQLTLTPGGRIAEHVCRDGPHVHPASLPPVVPDLVRPRRSVRHRYDPDDDDGDDLP